MKKCYFCLCLITLNSFINICMFAIQRGSGEIVLAVYVRDLVIADLRVSFTTDTLTVRFKTRYCASLA